MNLRLLTVTATTILISVESVVTSVLYVMTPSATDRASISSTALVLLFFGAFTLVSALLPYQNRNTTRHRDSARRAP